MNPRSKVQWLCLFFVLFAAACTSENIAADRSAADSGPPGTLPAARQSGTNDGAGGSTDGAAIETAVQGATESADGTAIDPAVLAALPVPVADLQPIWTSSGAQRTEATTQLDVSDFGAVPNDGQSDSAAFLAAVQQARQGGGVINVPSGAFLLTETLRLRSNITLRGVGPDTRLFFDLNDESGIAIQAEGEGNDSLWTDLTEVAEAGTTTLLVSNSAEFSVGDIIEVEQDNIEAMSSRPEWVVEWGEGSEGELARVAAVAPGVVELSSPLVSTYTRNRNAAVRPLDAVRNVGIESLYLSRQDTGYGHSIGFRYAADVWVTDVESEVTTRAHVGLDQVLDCSIQDSVFHDADDFGDGGRAYGVSLARHTTSCLITNNTLYELRHAIIIQLGASGNVVAYNHARGSAGYVDRQPRADLSLHGHWPQRNLFEGNVFDRVVLADWWGPSGPTNTLLRNCVLDSLRVAEFSHDQILLQNRVGSGGFTIEDDITGTVSFDNVVEGEVDGLDQAEIAAITAVPDSLWATEAPEFLADAPWPPINPSSGESSACAIPAGERSPLGAS